MEKTIKISNLSIKKIIGHLGINLTEEVKDLYSESYKTDERNLR